MHLPFFISLLPLWYIVILDNIRVDPDTARARAFKKESYLNLVSKNVLIIKFINHVSVMGSNFDQNQQTNSMAREKARSSAKYISKNTTKLSNTKEVTNNAAWHKNKIR